MTDKSEVARMLNQYDLEYQAGKRALEAPAIVGRHAFITRRMELMWEQMRGIENQVGREEAKKIMLGEHTHTTETQVQ